jgi:hypothetical protein
VVTSSTFLPWRSLEEDADGVPVRLQGPQRQMTTYDGLTEGCEDSPTDRAAWQVTLTRR